MIKIEFKDEYVFEFYDDVGWEKYFGATHLSRLLTGFLLQIFCGSAAACKK